MKFLMSIVIIGIMALFNFNNQEQVEKTVTNSESKDLEAFIGYPNTDQLVVYEDNYENIGKVGKYTLYVDHSQDFFAQALEKIYEDENNIYYFRELKSHIYLLKHQNEKLGIKEALQRDKITIDQLVDVLEDEIYVVKK